MNNRRLMILVSALLFASLSLMGIGVVQAKPPVRITIPTSGSFVLAECDGFDVIDEYAGRAIITVFYNQNGELVHLLFQQYDLERIYNSVTGFAVSSRFAVNTTINPFEGEAYIRGITLNITVPRYGIVMFDSSLGVFHNVDGTWTLVRFTGNNQAEIDLLCKAMDQ
jgi:hypothetical protein